MKQLLILYRVATLALEALEKPWKFVSPGKSPGKALEFFISPGKALETPGNLTTNIFEFIFLQNFRLRRAFFISFYWSSVVQL